MQINNTNKYHIIVNKSPEGGYSGQCLELAGAISEVETEEEFIQEYDWGNSTSLRINREFKPENGKRYPKQS